MNRRKFIIGSSAAVATAAVVGIPAALPAEPMHRVLGNNVRFFVLADELHGWVTVNELRALEDAGPFKTGVQ